jgi:ZIP family zinc transporter
MILGPLLVGLSTTCATFAGGALALRFHSRLAALIGLSSGAIIGVALIDLLPEAMSLAGQEHGVRELMLAATCGLVGYLLLDRLLSRFAGGRGHLGPASLTAHSMMDGLGIGLAFQVSTADGIIVAIAVLAHDLLDGANTVALSIAGGSPPAGAKRWLLADAVAPLVGIGVARLIHVPATTLAVLLAFFAGGFLYIGVGELLPRSLEGADSFAKSLSVALGAGLIYAIVRTIG